MSLNRNFSVKAFLLFSKPKSLSFFRSIALIKTAKKTDNIQKKKLSHKLNAKVVFSAIKGIVLSFITVDSLLPVPVIATANDISSLGNQTINTLNSETINDSPPKPNTNRPSTAIGKDLIDTPNENIPCPRAIKEANNMLLVLLPIRSIKRPPSIGRIIFGKL